MFKIINLVTNNNVAIYKIYLIKTYSLKCIFKYILFEKALVPSLIEQIEIILWFF